MKKLLLYLLLVGGAFTVLTIERNPVIVRAQTGNCGGLIAPSGVCVPVSTVANLQPAVQGALGYVSNGNSATDCTAGGGSTKVLCVYNGSAWSAMAAGGGGVTGTGTNNTVAKFTGTGTIGNGMATDTGTLYTITGSGNETLRSSGTPNPYATVTDTVGPITAFMQAASGNSHVIFGSLTGHVLCWATGGVEQACMSTSGVLSVNYAAYSASSLLQTDSSKNIVSSNTLPTGSAATNMTLTTPTATALAFSGSAPAITLSGTTPYLSVPLNKPTNTCTFNFTTGQFTLAASPLSMCSPVYTLPNAALTWAYECNFTWSVDAGTTPTLTFGQTFTQAPSAANEWQSIFTNNTGTSIQASQAVTTNSSMTATGTLTTSATKFQANIGGTFTASATSGNFSPTATLTGTGANGTLRGWCSIF